ncbi:MAG: hypothetical protein HGN29_15515 [Asgard group archaeon]|nr:hypothetical protein [Asgard group archaeon]
MSYLSSDSPTQIETKTDEELRRIIDDLHFVFSIFDEEVGPLILYDDSPLVEEVVQNLNIKVFHFLMQGAEFGPENYTSIRGIIQVPHSTYYTSAIDLLVEKYDIRKQAKVYVPLVLFLIFPKKDLVFYTKIANSIEDFFSKHFSDGIYGIPTIQTITTLLKQFRKSIINLHFI